MVLCFDVILSFSVTTQITAANQTSLYIHFSKIKGGILYKWPLAWNYAAFSATGGRNFLGKTVKCTGQKTRKAAILVGENRKPKTTFEKTRKPQRTRKPKNRSFQVRKPKNRTKHWPNPQNQKSQRPPPKQRKQFKRSQSKFNVASLQLQ